MPRLLLATATVLVALAGAAFGQQQPPQTQLRGGRRLATDTFQAPKVNGVRVDWCYGYDNRMGQNNPNAFLGCGQDAANAYCKLIGYDAAVAFEKESQITEPTIYILQNNLNQNPLHDAFKSITCQKADAPTPPPQPPTPPPVKPDPNPTLPADQTTFRYPRVSADGARVDWCAGYDNRVGGTNNPKGFIGCGQQAADLFCKSVGYDRAVRFEKAEAITEPTTYILQGVANPNPTHDAFSFIVCGKN